MAVKTDKPKVSRKVKAEALNDLLDVGRRMSDMCYNLAQESFPFDPKYRPYMDDLRKQWDAAMNKWRELNS